MIDVSKYTNDKALAKEYLRFLQLKFISDDFDAQKLSPSSAVDTLWHRHILDTRAYATDCLAMFGRVIHHNPDGANDDVNLLDRRYEKTLAAYQHTFGQEAPELFWPRNHPIHIFELKITLMTGTHIFRHVRGSMTVRDLKKVLHEDEDLAPEEQQRILANGRQLQDTDRLFDTCLDDSGLPKQVHVIHNLRGC